MMKTTKLALIVCLTLLIHKSAFSAACDEKLFSQPNADFSEKKDDFVTKNQVFFEIKDTFWSITKYTFKNTPVTKEQYPLFANIIHLRDNEKVSQQWYKNSRYDVLEAFMYHETELVKTIQRENGSSFYVVDATFDNKVSRFAYTAEFENNK